MPVASNASSGGMFLDGPAEPGRFGFGTTEAIDSLIRTLNVTRDTSVLLAVNVLTLLRNAIGTKDARIDEVVATTRKTVVGIANEITDMCKDRWKDRRHHLFFYLAKNEECIPEKYRRSSGSKSASILQAATIKFLKDVKPTDQEDGNVTFHFHTAPQMKIPSYKGIREAIDRLATRDIKLLMVSHAPIDYHTCFMTGRDGVLYRSHTGSEVPMTPSNLGKVVFKEDNVPFYPCTHVLFGDKDLIKGCMDRATKARILSLARQGRWSLNTNTYIEAKIKENGITLPYKL